MQKKSVVNEAEQIQLAMENDSFRRKIATIRITNHIVTWAFD